MGKRIITQRRGRGSMTYTANTHQSIGALTYPKEKNVQGFVKELLHSGNHNAPLMLIQYANGETTYMPAPLGIRVNEEIIAGEHADVKTGNIIPLKNIPEGTQVYNIEIFPGKSGFCRSAGSFATIIQRTSEGVIIKFPSRKEKQVHPECRATIGIVAGGGKRDKPFIKAGPMHHRMRAKGHLYPRTSGVAMNAVDHPFGSGRGRHVGKPKTPPRHAPPGRNVGLIRAKRTGRKR